MTSSVSYITIRTFGGVSAVLSNGRFARLQTNRARALLLFLVAGRGRLVHRESVAVSLWPDATEVSSRAQLRKTLWRVRSALSGQTSCAILQVDEQIGLEAGAVVADLWQLNDAVAAFDKTGGTEETAKPLMEILETTTGAFGAGLFDTWCLDTARQVEQDHLAAVQRVVAYLQRTEQFHLAVHWANHGLALDSLSEQLHRALMECHLSMGDAPSALRQYHTCRALLADSLGIAPSPETQMVRESVCAASGRTKAAQVLQQTARMSGHAKSHRRV